MTLSEGTQAPTDQLPTRANAFSSDPDHVKHVSGLPLKAQGSPDDVADAVPFPVSPAVSHLTGEVLNVAGGQPSRAPSRSSPSRPSPNGRR